MDVLTLLGDHAYFICFFSFGSSVPVSVAWSRAKTTGGDVGSALQRLMGIRHTLVVSCSFKYLIC